MQEASGLVGSGGPAPPTSPNARRPFARCGGQPPPGPREQDDRCDCDSGKNPPPSRVVAERPVTEHLGRSVPRPVRVPPHRRGLLEVEPVGIKTDAKKQTCEADTGVRQPSESPGVHAFDRSPSADLPDWTTV